MNLEPVQLKITHEYLAPDGSEIYPLVKGSKGNLCQCILPVGGISKAISHKTIEELWYFLDGKGEVWRKGLNHDRPIAVQPGTSLVIPVNTTFQFRNTGRIPLKFLIVSMPPWPGDSEVSYEAGLW